MAKRIAKRPDWLGEQIIDVYSVSGCISKYFANYISFWKHNGYWLFDSPERIEEVAREAAIDLTGATMFYYEVYKHQFDGDEKTWKLLQPEESFGVNVLVPAAKRLEGFDVATFFAGSTPECSPLSCNDLASSIHTNEHCLMDSLEEAVERLEAGDFANSEPGPYRIFAVYTLPSLSLGASH